MPQVRGDYYADTSVSSARFAHCNKMNMLLSDSEDEDDDDAKTVYADQIDEKEREKIKKKRKTCTDVHGRGARHGH